MGLFDIFKNKKENTSRDNLSLETLLQKASTEPAYRAEFYKRLLSDNLFVITQDSGLPSGEQTLAKETQVNIASLADGKIPVFTSTERIFDKGIVKEEVSFLEMNGKNIFSLAKGAAFILNPYSDYGKDLLPDEVEKMLNGTILTHRAKNLTIKQDTKILIGQPANYPTEMVNSLKELFSIKPNVKAAYIGWVDNPSSGDPPHHIFGLDAEGDLQSLTEEAGFTAKQYLKEDEFVDFIKIDNSAGISDYLKKTNPFYKK